MSTVQKRPLDWFRPDPTQPRKCFDMEELRRLNSTLRVKQLVPVLAKPDGTLVDGERRWRAGQLGGVEFLDAILTEEALSAAQIKEIQLVSALQRADLGPYEQFVGCQAWMAANPEGKAQDLATRIGRDPSMVSQILSLARCVPEVVEAAKAGRLGVTDWAVISKANEQEQRELLAAKLAGASRDELRRNGRKRRGSSSDAPKVSRLKCQLSGASVTIAARAGGLSLDSIVDLISDLLKEARKANDSGISAKTWGKTLRDRHSHD